MAETLQQGKGSILVCGTVDVVTAISHAGHYRQVKQRYYN